MSENNILLVLPEKETGRLLERAAASLTGSRLVTVNDWEAAREILNQERVDLAVVSEQVGDRDGAAQALRIMEDYPAVAVALLAEDASGEQVLRALRQGFFDCIQWPLSLENLQQLAQRTHRRRRRLQTIVQQMLHPHPTVIERRMSDLEAIQRVGRTVTALLDLDSVLASVVDAAVELTGAEEGSLLLLDETTGELYMRASKNFQQEFARTFRQPIRSSLIGQVVRQGKPLVIDESTPQKIKTDYLVHTLIYMPLLVQERVIGVLEVDHRQTHKTFSDEHITMMAALADYAAIAIENARLYSRSQEERNKLEMILRGIEDGVIVLDSDRRLVLINRRACEAFDVDDSNILGKRLREVISHQELLETIRDASPAAPSRAELTLADGRTMNAQLTPLPEIGLVVTMQDITHLKELDRIKSDFVNTVSHDLRSPLTAILGYIELIERVGSVNNQQHEFIRRVQVSVQNITSLINDLLDLGRIEAGFDVRKEIIPFPAMMQYVIDGLRPRAAEKSQELVLDMPEDLPPVLGNPVRLRQMLNNLVLNAIKYTQTGGQVVVSARAQASQMIIQVSDNGPGIPPADQPYIFDKFYRASNAPYDIPGTGLGLAIVKSIVENHQGRIWVKSQPGQGAAFTVILPTSEQEL